MPHSWLPYDRPLTILRSRAHSVDNHSTVHRLGTDVDAFSRWARVNEWPIQYDWHHYTEHTFEC